MKNKPELHRILIGYGGMLFGFLLIFSCSSEDENAIFPELGGITESVYASGQILAVDQYEAFTNASGAIQEIFVSEGDSVEIGTPILAVYSEREKLSRESAEIARNYADLKTNQSKLRDLQLTIDLAKSKMSNDSLLYERQRHLWKQNIGTEVQLEQKELAYENSKTAFENAEFRYEDLKKEIEFNEKNASKNLAISRVLESEFVLKSKIKGTLYALLMEKGEMVTPQVPLAVLGSTGGFLLELKVDEYDISKIKIDQPIIVSMDSYKGETFEAKVTKIYPIMDSDTKSFTIEAEFTKAPPRLYPNLTLEANIILEIQIKTLIIPRAYLINDQFVLNEAGDTIPVKVGIRNYQSAQILEGITSSTKIIKPGS
ncbi:efflux RND transporter periplasmic adaptor subunit [Algoriphagus antarcticus]|uniref:Multidrug efflux pump subunit AcrA (Membrane-fusion protein) n=1 Tax=Algoriphagus antarcticus TaxID=238540 RepID=A0A3E0DHW9_9BACT|nr:efflux RND transporter periplasmic adaptor subunit [Algoriphagus antarcticus]REG82321.1 multidrug efflux pump subunit AcrA (membrane-fusion protein) [Algoriphagus antarcticus]